MSKKTSPAEPLPTPSSPDEHHGQGGSYVVDPQTGRRDLQERTQEAEAAATETKE